ncbi:MAG: hypothetical protein ABIK81_03665 [candidate division WOR-3 bacterium]
MELSKVSCEERFRYCPWLPANLGRIFIPKIIIVLLLSCLPQGKFLSAEGETSLRGKDAEKKASVGHYEDFFIVSNGNGFKKDVAKWRREIEKDKKFLIHLTKKFFPIPDDTEFEFKFVGRDTVNRYLFLRYFAPLRDPKGEIAGWQVLFIFRERDKSCEKILISEVPLE